MKRIAIDLGGLDKIGHGYGQFRYCVDLLNGLHKHCMEYEFYVLGAFNEPCYEISNIFIESKINWKYYCYSRSVYRGASYWEHIKLWWFLTINRINLYHCLHTFVPLISPCKSVVTLCDLYYEIFPEYEEALVSRPYRIFRWACKNKADALICISKATLKDVHKFWKIHMNRLHVSLLGTNFIQNKHVILNDQASSTTDKAYPIILSHYTLEPRKNLRTLVIAFAEVRQSFPNARLVLFGHDHLIDNDRELVFNTLLTELKLGKSFVRTGFLKDSDLIDLMDRATLFVFPSLYEGFGYPVLEAMSRGVCVVARNASAMAEVVADAGILVETADPKLLASAIVDILGSPDKINEFRSKALQRSKNFTVEDMTAGHLQVYRSLLSK
jgi:glycosyltransferase involved in cell wall biosynthesis